MLVRLTVKLAEVLEGVDLSAHAEGDLIELSERDANLLLAGGWAERVTSEQRITCEPRQPLAIAADKRQRSNPISRS
jgi:hypothetical protein